MHNNVGNKFYQHSYRHFQNVTDAIINDRFDNDYRVENVIVSFAIGIERLLKGLLFDINPIFICPINDEKITFAKITNLWIYENQAINKKIENVNQDTIALKEAIYRASIFSNTVNKYKEMLSELKNARDIIMHHDYGMMNKPKIINLIKRDFYPFLKNFIDEHGLKNGLNNFFKNKQPNLISISQTLQDDIKNKISLEIERARNIWQARKNNNSFNTKKINQQTEATGRLNDNIFIVKCPCCNNQSLLYTIPTKFMRLNTDNTYSEEIVDRTKQRLECEFCDLKLDNEMLQQLNHPIEI